ncbi:zinc-dependent metalloprotease [Portibacter lacus]|uniref:T9SS type A sorting domain-containing protein n=1 Tax=Portibacter lacus TaxID=1099794 RepID=A0AA37WE58_9BACT|nr:zinc-dependent metalloprotease [Portibacter lacus]GLR16364.1 hypothetical protein GCM10007940_09790 [Portibacter lacus]
MNKSFIIFFISIFAHTLIGQTLDYCGTEGVNEEWETFLEKNNDLLVTSRNCEVYVPLTVHILGDDNGIGYHPLSSIFENLETLNKDFEEAGITFYLAGPLNYINKTSWYDHSEFNSGSQMMNTNNVANTINTYIVQNPAGNCGYRAYDGDAIALAKSCSKPGDHTWAHEMGHWLSLRHTFYGWERTTYDDSMDTPSSIGSQNVELLNGENCNKSADNFCDTPPDYLSYRWSCDDNNEFPDSLKDPSGKAFAVDGSLFMSYASDDCQSRFSGDQIEAMCSYMQNWVPEVISNKDPLAKVDISETELIYPIGGEEVMGEVKLKWEEEGNATFYIVEVSRFSNLGILSLRELVRGNELDVFGLSSGKKYYWRVRALNEYDFDYKGNMTETESFVTGELSSTTDYYTEHLQVYPNPASQNDIINVSLDSQTGENITLTITSLDGRNAYRKEHYLRNGSNQLEISTASMPSGIYFMTGIGELHKFQKKIVIE